MGGKILLESFRTAGPAGSRMSCLYLYFKPFFIPDMF
jgi:hypothetical protein